jgi:hypothetical protein
MSDVATIIEQIAQADGVDPRLALATAQQESGLDPTDVGDQGTSFGLYQLHQGGELGNLSEAQAFDPATNASKAIGVIAQAQAADPTGTPGQIAANAQRPANPASYAAAVNAIYASDSFMPNVPASTQAVEDLSITGALKDGATAVFPGESVGLGIAGEAAGGAISSAESSTAADVGKVAGNVALIVLGLGLIGAGVFKLASPGQSVASSVSSTAQTGGKVAEVAAV